MVLDTVYDVLKYLFMGVFIVFFVMDIVSKRSYKIQYYVAITIAVIFTALSWDWSIGFRIGFIALFAILTIKTIFDEKKREARINAGV